MKSILIFLAAMILTISVTACDIDSAIQAEAERLQRENEALQTQTTSEPVQKPESTPSPTPAPTPQPQLNTGIVIEYDMNLIMNKYDIRISVGDTILGTQEQGKKEFYELTLTEGTHTITFSEFGNDENKKTEQINVLEGEYYYFFIKTRNSGIEIEKKDILTLDEALSFVPTPAPATASPVATSPSNAPVLESITVDNNKDFANLLSIYVPRNEDVDAFVEKYMDRTIEFDGFVFISWRQIHDLPELRANNRYVVIVPADCADVDRDGDWHGPVFQMNGVSIRDFPAIEVEDKDVRVVAKITGVGYEDDYSVNAAYIILEPISVELRRVNESRTAANNEIQWDDYFTLMDELQASSNGNIIEFRTARKDDYDTIQVIVSDSWYNSTTQQKERFVESVMESIEKISDETGVSQFVEVYFYDTDNTKLAEPRGYGYRILR